MRCINLIILTSFLTGCLIIPVGLPDPEPYNNNTIADLGAQNLDREEIRASMGEPDVVRGNGTVWIYGKRQNIAELLNIMLYMAVPVGVNDYFVVVIEFSDNIASHIELLDLGWNEARGCTTTGICLHWFGFGEGAHHLSSEFIVVNSKPEDDAKAKNFATVEEMCSVYFFTNLLSSIRIDMGQSTLIDNKDYIHLLLQPGVHKISGKVVDLDIAETIKCAAESVAFYKLTIRQKFLRRGKSLVENLSYGAGMKEISKRQLVMLQ